MVLSDLVVLIYLAAIVLVSLALLAVYKSGAQELSEKTTRHFAESANIAIGGHESRGKRQRANRIQQLFWRAGVEPSQWHIVSLTMLACLLTLIVAAMQGILAALLMPLLLAALVYFWLWHKGQSRIKAIIFQLPLFLDQVLRALSTGRSMESALGLATQEAAQPLKDIFERVLRANQLGKDLGQAIQETAELYRVQELYLISLAIRVNRSYGSSVRELLNNIVKMIHDREATRRELRTLTGETRVTAWVLGLLPIMIAGYIVMMNPGYMETMWEDSAGRIMLVAALLFQAIGAFALWRMIKSI
ncbi:type II secretion system F family protein [Methylophaga sp. OBS4]|uniref:type II secretion system F family protein n=1 Tax=Methylophaga sp. OBS4 TaxID=2991935 RepID=UPI003A4C8258